MSEYLHKIQKHIFFITLGTSVMLGLSMAYFVSSLIPFLLSESGSAAEKSTGRKSSPRRMISKSFKSVENYYAIASGNMIRDSVITATGSIGPGETIETSGAAEISVMGMISGSPRFARVAIQIKGEPEANEYKTGDMVGGFKIISINDRSITVERGGGRMNIGVGESSSDTKASSDNAGVGTPEVPDAPPGATRITISRNKLLKLTRDQSELYKNKFTPVVKNGAILGLRLIYVPNDNFLYELGARSGDIIRRVNGEPLENNEKIMEFYMGLKSAERVTVDLERAGKIVSYEVLIK